eukprot:1159002-Pelagomonas_calceolata.AAC.8
MRCDVHILVQLAGCIGIKQLDKNAGINRLGSSVQGVPSAGCTVDQRHQTEQGPPPQPYFCSYQSLVGMLHLCHMHDARTHAQEFRPTTVEEIEGKRRQDIEEALMKHDIQKAKLKEAHAGVCVCVVHKSKPVRVRASVYGHAPCQYGPWQR